MHFLYFFVEQKVKTKLNRVLKKLKVKTKNFKGDTEKGNSMSKSQKMSKPETQKAQKVFSSFKSNSKNLTER